VASVAAARRFIASSLADWDRASEVEDVVLLTSEVVTNLVMHAGPHGPGEEIVVDVHWADDLVRVEVSDWRPGTLPADQSIGPDGLSGRELLLLDVLARAWGVRASPAGKTVWFELKG